MRITYYRLPQDLPAREQYKILKAEGFTSLCEPPQDMTDEEILKVLGINHQCKLTEAKRMIKKYGGSGFTEWFDRDGSFTDSTALAVKGRNKGSYGSI